MSLGPVAPRGQLVDLGHAIGSLARLSTPELLNTADARADLASAEAGLAAEPLQAELLVAELATLQAESVTRLLALAAQLGVQRGLVVYGFGNEATAQRLRQAGWHLSRAPLADAELRTQVAEAAAALGVPASAHPPDLQRPLAKLPVPPRRFDDAALHQFAAAATTVACEAPWAQGPGAGTLQAKRPSPSTGCGPILPGLESATMQTARPLNRPLRTAITLAELLQRIEASAQPIGAAQYRRLVRHLAQLLDSLPPGPDLDQLLQTFPAAAGLYENQHYDMAGLCRSPLEASLNSELSARAVIDKARAN